MVPAWAGVIPYVVYDVLGFIGGSRMSGGDPQISISQLDIAEVVPAWAGVIHNEKPHTLRGLSGSRMSAVNPDS